VRRFVLPEEGTAKDAMDAKVGEGEAGGETLDASTDERESE
jgi:hypothetical protein